MQRKRAVLALAGDLEYLVDIASRAYGLYCFESFGMNVYPLLELLPYLLIGFPFQ